MDSSHKSEILDLLDLARGLGYPKQVYLTSPNLPIEPLGFMQPWTRLVIILSGSKKVTLALPRSDSLGHVRTIDLKAGDAYLAAPYSWESYKWDSECRMLCIVPRGEYLRISCHEQKRALGAETIFHHTERPYSESLRHTVDALNALKLCRDGNPEIYLCKALIDLGLDELRNPVVYPAGKSERTFRQIRRWLENSIQEDINREEAARIFNLSPSYVSQLFKKRSGMGFQKFLTRIRLEHAKKILKNSDLTVYQVADQCGFGNYVHFVRRFREIEGLPPGKYRESHLDI